MKIEHIVYNEDGKEFKSFLNSSWYDTATPYQFCISELKLIKNKLLIGQTFKIDSNNKIHNISSLDDYRKWLEKVFFGGFEEFVFENDK